MPDLHADAEGWSDSLDDATCGVCGGPRVVFIPVWADGGGILTPEEIAEVLGRARLRVMEEWERTEADGRGLEPMEETLADDVVLRVDGYRDGRFRAVVSSARGADGQIYVRYGRGSRLTGSFGWRHGLAVSRYTHQVTTPEEAAAGMMAYEGAPGILNFTRRAGYERNTPEAQEEFRLEQALRDRTSRTTAWERHLKEHPRPPGMEDGDAEGGGGQAAV